MTAATATATARKGKGGTFRKAALRTPEERNALIAPHLALPRWVLNRQRADLIVKLGGWDDCEQELTIGLMRCGDLYDPASGIKFCTYAVRCLELIFRSLLERKLTGRPILLPLLHADRIEAPDYLDTATTAEARERIEAGLARLEARDALAVRMYYLDGLNRTEIGQRMGVSKERVRQILERAEIRLVREMMLLRDLHREGVAV